MHRRVCCFCCIAIHKRKYRQYGGLIDGVSQLHHPRSAHAHCHPPTRVLLSLHRLHQRGFRRPCSLIAIILPLCCLRRRTRVPSSFLSRSPTEASPSARRRTRAGKDDGGDNPPSSFPVPALVDGSATAARGRHAVPLSVNLTERMMEPAFVDEGGTRAA